MQTDDAAFEKRPQSHTVPTVVVGITDNKTGQHKEEVYGQIAMIDDLFQMIAARMSFKHVKDYHHDSSYTAQAVQNFIMWL